MRGYIYNLATDRCGGFIASLIKIFLFILSLIYGLGVVILSFFCRLKRYRLNCKVISVGNITLGGTGKTTLVEYIAKYLRSQDHKVAILSRGYKRKAVSGQRSAVSGETMGDEPYMLTQKLADIPVIVDSNRIRGGNRAIKDHSVDTVILDDGFQQWKIKKDLEIVTIDATNPFGNQHLIPRGILREPISSLRRAGIFVLTKTNLNPDILDLQEFLSQINPQALTVEAIHNPIGFYKLGKNKDLLRPEMIKGKIVTLASGIADPDSFENLIKDLDIKIGLSFRFPDHHRYTQEDLEKIFKSSQQKHIDTIITTEKDAARLYAIRYTLYAIHILVLRIEIEITENEQAFHNRLLGLYSF